ncbi:MAG: CoA transferase [Proteobacteria bacterium]|nr:CoA transferase [Pseudomonadota bacterium]
MSGALEGIRVLDMSRVLAGPWAGQLLGDFGADIVKVERPVVGDDTRHWGPPWLDRKNACEAAYFLSTNRNKRSITVDLADIDGQALIQELAKKADVLIENYRVGTLAGYGLGAEDLLHLNPRLIYCSITAYGQRSSKASEPGYDAIIQASAGLMSITGAPDCEGGSPQKVGVAVSDIMAGMYAATAILAALQQRSQTGLGQHIDLSLYDSQVAWLANQAMNFLIGGETPLRRGTAHPNLVPYQAFETCDGFLILAIGNDRQFVRLTKCIGKPELATDTRFQRNSQRVEFRGPLVDILAAVFRTRNIEQWLKALGDADVPCGPINTIDEVLTGAFAEERGLVQTMVHPMHDALPTVANPVRFSQTPVSYRLAPPTLGQHTHEILTDWLDYTDQDFEKLNSKSDSNE